MSPPAEWQPVSIKPWCPSTSLYPAYFQKQVELLSLERGAAGTTRPPPPNESALQSNGLLLQNGLFAVFFSGTHTRKPLTFLSLFLTTALQNGRIREDRFEEWRGGSEVQLPHAS